MVSLCKPCPPRCAGLTLVELLLVLTVSAILAALAYPQYSQHMQRGRRAQAQANLLGATQFLQRFYAAQGVYSGAELPAAYRSSDGYQLSLVVGEEGQSFTLSATPQHADALCGTLHLADTGAKSQSGTGRVMDCW